MATETEKIDRKHVIRRRNATNESHKRACVARVRMTQQISANLASLQGLCWRYGKGETLADLWEAVCMPALIDFVRPYADKAREDRAATAEKREG